jgi:hypothetical protein
LSFSSSSVIKGLAYRFDFAEAPVHPSDEEVHDFYEAAVLSALKSPEFDQIPDDAPGLDAGVEAAAAKIKEAEAEVSRRAQTMLDGWRLAEARLAKARAVRLRKLAPPVVIGLLVAIAAGVALAWGFDSQTFWTVALGLAGILFGYLGAIGTELRVKSRRVAKSEALARYRQVLDGQAIVVVREAINQGLASYRTDFRIFDDTGLRQMADLDREVPTAAVEKLGRLIRSLDGGSIGLSGPRGSGKTTIITSFTEGRSIPFPEERIGLMVSAPVKYDPLEFVLHLFGRLCEHVIDGELGGSTRAGERRRLARDRKMAFFSVLVGAALLVVGLTLKLEPSVSRADLGRWLIVVGGTIVYAFLLVSFLLFRQSKAPNRKAQRKAASSGDVDTVKRNREERQAREYLTRIRFQQSQEGGGSIKVSLLGLELGGSATKTISRAPWTLPQAVDELRGFVGELTGRFVIIGIDELDKMETTDVAREFLNNVKGIFGVGHCYYIVSISEEAMGAFERRGLPVRDVFDSSFDEVQSVGYLTLDESRGVLNGRVIGLPVPYQCLCHCISGGLPRELIRVTRELINHPPTRTEESGGIPTMSELASVLVIEEWRTKLKAATLSGRSRDGTQPWWLTKWLHEQELAGQVDGDELRRLTLAIGDHLVRRAEDDATRLAQRIAAELVVFNYFATTVLDLFAVDAGLALFGGATLDAKPAQIVGSLSKARQEFAVDPWLSWELIEESRSLLEVDHWPVIGLRPAG